MGASLPCDVARAWLGCALACTALVVTAGCGRRAVAYHFRGPLVGAVNASPRLSQPDPAPALDPEPDPVRARYREGGRDHRRGRAGPVARRPVRLVIPSDSLRTADDPAAGLRALVGGRDEESSHVQFALATLSGLGAGLDPRLRDADDGPALRDLAAERGALIVDADSAATRPRLGDLLLFDGVVAEEPASLVAVAISTDSRGVVEFIYLARGVVRRGFLDRAHPTDKRDADGRILNTFVRHSDGTDPAGTRYLAGELHTATIRLDRLLR
jgi:hypothetical protein